MGKTFKLSRKTDVLFIAVYVLSTVNTCSAEIRLNSVHKLLYTSVWQEHALQERTSVLQEHTSFLKEHACALQELVYFWQEHVSVSQ